MKRRHFSNCGIYAAVTDGNGCLHGNETDSVKNHCPDEAGESSKMPINNNALDTKNDSILDSNQLANINFSNLLLRRGNTCPCESHASLRAKNEEKESSLVPFAAAEKMSCKATTEEPSHHHCHNGTNTSICFYSSRQQRRHWYHQNHNVRGKMPPMMHSVEHRDEVGLSLASSKNSHCGGVTSCCLQYCSSNRKNIKSLPTDTRCQRPHRDDSCCGSRSTPQTSNKKRNLSLSSWKSNRCPPNGHPEASLRSHNNRRHKYHHHNTSSSNISFSCILFIYACLVILCMTLNSSTHHLNCILDSFGVSNEYFISNGRSSNSLFFVSAATTCFSIDSTDSSVCSSHGVCQSTDLCLCHMGYYGSDCSGFLPANRPTVTIYGLGQNNDNQLQDSQTYSIEMMNSTLQTDEEILFSIAGQQHSTYFTNQNRTFSWGFYSKTGLGTASNVEQPELITDSDLSGKYITYMDSFIHTVVVTSDNELYGWGKNSERQIDSSGTDQPTPVPMVMGEIGTNRVVGIACGTFVTIFMDDTGAVYTQGMNANGKSYFLGIAALGAGATQSTPRRIDNLDTKTAFFIAAGEEHAHVITTDNLIYGWGNGPFTGTGNTDAVNTPTQVSTVNLGAGEQPLQICDGAEHGMLRTSTGNTYTWGFTFQGALGQGSGTVYSLQPTKVSGGSLSGVFVEHIACAGYMSVALDSNGNVHRWGRAAVSSALPQSDVPILINLEYDNLSILNHSYIAQVSVGQGHVLIDSYKIPTCFVGEWYNGAVCSGRGECIADDICQCETGYDGSQCQFYLCYGYNSNQTEVCSSHGQCVDVSTCQCDTGYDGVNCELSNCYGILSNETNVCSNYGNCTSPDTCDCETGYYGNQCQYWNCSSVEAHEPNVCSTHGNCLSPELCSCEYGYFGDNCEVIQCFDYFSNMTEVCSAGRGDCASPNFCNCTTGYGGSECEFNICYNVFSNETSVCTSHGNCTDADTCICEEGYGGVNCELFYCFNILSNESAACSGRGSCSDVDNCVCDSGYGGENCEYNYCYGILSNESTVCSTHGDCYSPDLCNCTTGYAGPECSLNICYNILSNESSVCSTHGNCSAPDQCDCSTGYAGSECELNICFDVYSNESSVCSTHGDCYAPDSCNCTTGYGGDQCQFNYCYGVLSNETNVCSYHGNCTSPDTCECETDYGGVSCELFYCFNILSNMSSVCSGRGSCSDVDNCLCDDGYGGENCQYNYCYGILSNESTVCFTHGDCYSPDLCNCTTGYAGPECSLNVCFNIFSNESSVCSSHGNCSSPDQCDCTNGYAGSECELNICFNIYSNESSVCSTHGECYAPDSCNCTTGYGGSECEFNICNNILSNESSVCSYHGNCTSPDTCECEADYGGVNCELFYCFNVLSNMSSVCSGRGSCSDVDNCICDSGYGGENCQYNYCYGILSNESTVCSTHGECYSPNSCNCTTGYAGPSCELNICYHVYSNESSVCSTHGNCSAPDQCDCSTGYAGSECELNICFNIYSNESSVCSTHGDCFAPDACNCTTGYGGSECEFNICNNILSNETNVCSYHGNCTSPDTCECEADYGGENCELFYCFNILSNESSVCSGRGSCSDVDNCLCDDGYGGENCQYNYCYGILSNESTVCFTHGECYSPDLCNCTTGYAGPECSLNICYNVLSNESSVCSTHGNCSAPDQCDCTNGYAGSECELNICFNIYSNESSVCSTHGECYAPDSCNCTTGYGGSECEFNICNNILSNETNVCSSHGNCTSPDTCECEADYGGENCELFYCFNILSNMSSVCSGRGSCSDVDNCICDSGYGGVNCELNSCFSILSNESSVCSTHGECYSPDLCNCTTGYAGPACELNICYDVLSNSSSVCSGHGNCSSPDSCTCFTGYSGTACELNICFEVLSNVSTVCSSHGDCYAPDSCNCTTGYGGSECELNICDNVLSNESSVCSSHGNCSSPDQCDCLSGYAGQSCELNICYGILSNDSSVCNSRGACHSPDSCSCISGYTGSECQFNLCYNVSSNSSAVCSSHGSCLSPDTCECEADYGGVNCELFYCSGTLSNESSVCSGRGSCVDVNTCNCDSGYGGTNCELNACFSILSNESSVCNSRGDCLAPNSCNCTDGHAGPACELNICYDVLSNSSSVCSGHGNCSSPDSCTCFTGYSGTACELNICFGVLSNNSSVCSTHGDCIAPDSCSCDSSTATGYFSGSDCSSCDAFHAGDNCTELYCDRNATCSAHGDCNDAQLCSCDRGFQGDQCSVCVEPTSTFPNCIVCYNKTTCNSHGLCTVNETCSCFQSESDGFYGGYNCESCSGNWTGPSCQVLLPQSFQLSSDGKVLSAEFIDATSLSRPSIFDCSHLFSAASVEMLGGNEAICQWPNSSSTLEIQLSSSSTVSPGDNLQVAELPGDSSTTFRSVAVLAPLSPQKPNAMLEAPDLVGLCMDITLDASQSVTFRPLTYVFSSNSSAFDAALAPSSGSSVPTRTISSTTLNAVGAGVYEFVLQTENFYGGTNTDKKLLTYVKDSIPVVDILGSQDILASPTQQLIVTGRAVSSCESLPYDESAVSFFWNQTSGPTVAASSLSFSNNNQKMTIAPRALALGTYVFQFSAQHANLPYPSSIDVRITVQYQDLVAIIEGGDGIVPSNRDALLDGRSSYDPDEVFSSDGYAFQWSCFDFASADVCTFMYGMNTSASSLSIPSGTLVDGHHYRFTLNYSSADRFSVTSVTWTAQADQLVYVSLRSLSTYISHTKNLDLTASVEVDRPSTDGFVAVDDSDPDVSYSWFMSTESSAEIPITTQEALTSTNQRAITLNSNIFTPGLKHNFRVRVDVSDLSQSATATVSTIVNKSPQSGTFSISPSIGYAQETNFLMTTTGWSDIHTPLQYQFYYKHPSTDAISTVSPLSSATSISQVTFPSFSYSQNISLEVGVIVYDMMGASSTQASNITILASSLSRNETITRMEKELTEVGDIVGLADLTTLLRNYLEIAQTLLSHEALYCSTGCSSKGNCITEGLDYKTCVCEPGSAGKDCSSVSEVKVRAEDVKQSTLRALYETLSRDEYSTWSAEDATLVAEILSTLSHDFDEISDEMVSLSLPVIHALITKGSTSLGQETTSSVLQTLSILDGKMLDTSDACAHSKFSPLPTTEGTSANSSFSSRQLFEQTLNIMSSYLYTGEDPIIEQYPYSIFYVKKNFFKDYRLQNGSGVYNIGSKYHGDYASANLPSELLSTSADAADMQFMSVVKSPFPCADIPQNSQFQSHTVMLRFMDSNGTKIDIHDLSEPIELSIPGEYSVPQTSGGRTYNLVCRYFDETTDAWKSDGCTLKSYSANETVCQCTHTTYFAVFLEYTDKDTVDPEPVAESWAVFILIGSVAAAILLCACFCFCCTFCFILCFSIRRVHRQKARRKNKYSVEPETDAKYALGRKLSSSSLQSDLSLHPWDSEYRGLPYFMRKYRSKEGDSNSGSQEATTSDDDQEGSQLFEKTIAVKVQSRKKQHSIVSDLADPKLEEDDDEPDVAMGMTLTPNTPAKLDSSVGTFGPSETSMVEEFIEDSDSDDELNLHEGETMSTATNSRILSPRSGAGRRIQLKISSPRDSYHSDSSSARSRPER